MNSGTRRTITVCLIVGFAVLFSSLFQEAAAGPYGTFIQSTQTNCTAYANRNWKPISDTFCQQLMTLSVIQAGSFRASSTSVVNACKQRCTNLANAGYLGCPDFCSSEAAPYSALKQGAKPSCDTYVNKVKKYFNVTEDICWDLMTASLTNSGGFNTSSSGIQSVCLGFCTNAEAQGYKGCSDFCKAVFQ